jgi:hypothetical protein
VKDALNVRHEAVQQLVPPTKAEARSLARRKRVIGQAPRGVGGVHALLLSEGPGAFNSA